MREDYDFTAGFLLVILAGINWLISIIFGFMSLNPIFLFNAVVSLIWFLFAPVYISQASDIRMWTHSEWGHSIWGAVLWRHRHPYARDNP